MASNRNRVLVPEAKEALSKFKFETARELGVDLKQGYNGDLTSRENGSVGGKVASSQSNDASRCRASGREPRTGEASSQEQVLAAHFRNDEGRERPWSELAVKVAGMVCGEEPEEG